jgi:anthranilate 1,2-dioxygenase (deaminating, decarboxylating) small subunit
MRIERLAHEATASQLPRSRVNHHLSNITVADEPDAGVTARAYLLYIEHRRDEQRTFSGRGTWRLQPHGDSFLIAHKRVDLLNADQDSGHLRFSIPF